MVDTIILMSLHLGNRRYVPTCSKTLTARHGTAQHSTAQQGTAHQFARGVIQDVAMSLDDSSTQHTSFYPPESCIRE